MKFTEMGRQVIIQDIDAGITPALMGDAAIGKSSWVESLADHYDSQVFTLECNTLAGKEDLTAPRLLPDGNGGYAQFFYPHKEISDAIAFANANPTKTVVLLLDEINRANGASDITSAVLTLVTRRRIGSVDLPANLRLIVAGNDKGNITALDDASLSRFAVYRVEPDAQTFMDVEGDALHPWIRQVLQVHPQLVFARTAGSVAVDGNDDDDAGTATIAELFDSGEEMNQFTAPRTLRNLSKWLHAADPTQLLRLFQTPTTIDDRETTMLNEVVEAKVGNTAFTMQLMSVIATALSSGNANAAPAAVTVTKPNGYDTLKMSRSITDMQQYIVTMDSDAKSAALVYALHERSDNQLLIEQLAAHTTQIVKTDMQLLVNLLNAGQLNIDNVEALQNSDTPIAQRLEPTISSFV